MENVKMEEIKIDGQSVDGEVDQLMLRAKITDHCVKCIKRSIYTTITITEKTPPAPFVMMAASPLTVLIAERIVKKNINNELLTYRWYQLYRCKDSMCLVKHLHEAMMIHWIQNEAIRNQKEIEDNRFKAMHSHKVTSRRSNRRNKAKHSK